jgi:DNA-binding transcriptional LysR family regulator
MLSLVAAGLGVTIVPASVRNLGRIGVEFRPLAGPKVMAQLALMYRPARLSRALEAFIAIAQLSLNT